MKIDSLCLKYDAPNSSEAQKVKVPEFFFLTSSFVCYNERIMLI